MTKTHNILNSQPGGLYTSNPLPTNKGISRRSLVVGGAAGIAYTAADLLLPRAAFADKLDEQIAAKQAEADKLAGEITECQAEIEQILDTMHSAEEDRDNAKAESEQAEEDIAKIQ